MTKRKVSTELSKRDLEFCKSYEKHAGQMQLVCKDLNITVGSARNILCKPAVKERLSMALQRSREMIVAGTPEVVRKLYEMLYDERTPIKVKAQIATSLLDRAGLNIPSSPPVQVNINTELIDRARLVLAEKVNPIQTELTLEGDQGVLATQGQSQQGETLSIPATQGYMPIADL